jgi:ABC-2 type transport system permease protein
VVASRDLFGNLPANYRLPDAWPMQHPVLASLLWSILIIVIFRTLAVRKYRSATA